MELSFGERLLQAKGTLNHVKTVVTSEDGACTIVEKLPDGSFGQSESNEEITGEIDEEEVETDNSNGQPSSSLLSKKQIKKRERLQRYGFIVDLEPDLQMANVAKGVYLGSQDVAHSLELLVEKKITHIINCATGVANIYEGKFKYLNIEIFDMPDVNIRVYFDEAHQFMRKCVEGGGNVFVHCNAGISRSPTIVLSYIMRYERKTLKEALQQVKAVRNVLPNPGFMLQLELYEEELNLSN